MSDLVFDFEWADPLGARGPELRATWARLAIQVDGRYPSRVLDQEARTVRDSVYVPLYPIAEWIVSNWWRLLFEMESPERVRDPLYPRRHSLRWAREGYSVPPLTFTAIGERLQLDWKPELLTHHRVEFLESGSAFLARETVERNLAGFISAVISRLDECNVSGTFLQREWDAISRTAGEESEFCIAAATLGLDPYDLDDTVAKAIVAVAAAIPATLRREFFNIASHDRLDEESNDVASAINTARDNHADLRPLRQLRTSISQQRVSNGHAPWKEGYSAAQTLRKDLDIGIRPVRSLADLAQALQVDPRAFDSAIFVQETGTHPYEVVVAMNRNSSPAFAITRRHEAARRFQVCRGLYEFLSDGGDGPWIVTTGLSERQKRNRAFAAEFLAPAAGIQERVSSSVVSSEEVDDLADHFCVSSDAIVHQLSNHRIASVAW